MFCQPYLELSRSLLITFTAPVEGGEAIEIVNETKGVKNVHLPEPVLQISPAPTVDSLLSYLSAKVSIINDCASALPSYIPLLDNYHYRKLMPAYSALFYF